MPPSYSPITGLLYVPAMDIGGIFFTSEVEYRSGEFFMGSAGHALQSTIERHSVAIRALNPLMGDVQWEYDMKLPTSYGGFGVGGLMSTAGGVLFGSIGTLFLALDANTGQELWRLNTGTAIQAAPITFLSEGKQLVTVPVGRALLTFGL